MERTDDELIVEKCLRAAQRLNVEAYLVAREGFGWSRERFEQAEWEYQCRQRERWYGGGQ